MSDLSRRCFLECAAGGAGALLLTQVAGCGGGGSTAGSITPVNGKAELTFAMFPKLMTVGSGVVVDSPQGPIAVLRTGDATASALSAVCTHQGCTVDVQGGQAPLFCGCHGSEFDANGRVLVGPARTSLRSYAAVVDATGVTVTLG